MHVVDVLLLVVAGVGAGLCGSMAGLASLFSYPALLAVGLSPVVANQTNTVALAISSLGSIAGSRPELRGQRRRVLRLLPLTLLGGAVGAALVLLTPSSTFALIVPFLVAGASLVLLAPPPDPSAGRHQGPAARAATLVGVVTVGVYSGYFGAAAGVVMMALLVRALADTLIRVNAVKNVLLGAANAIAALGFLVVGEVSWRAALPLIAGLLAGNVTGPAIARRLPPRVLRVGVAVAGLVLAAVLLWRALGPAGR